MMERSGKFEAYFQERAQAYQEFLRELVKLESPSGEIALIDKCIHFLAEEIKSNSDQLKITPGVNGSSLIVEKGRGSETLLILGHIDTVWPVDAENKPPMICKDGIMRGPGVLDMKAGLAMVKFAFAAFDELALIPDKKIVFLVTPDEEISSPTSRDIIEELARQSDRVLVIEPPLADGSMKTRRKGIGAYTLSIKGKEAHAGINPEDGINAIHEMGLQIPEILKLNDPAKGTTVNVDMIKGGTARNVIPGKVVAEIDFRAETIAEAHRVEAFFENLKPMLPGAKLTIEGGLDRPPMEDSPESNRMADIAREIGLELGMTLERKHTGGGSDGNFTAALGVPTLDGLGMDGSGAHTPDEHILLEKIPARCALLAELILSV